jgi:hypothetical protein
MNPKNKAYLILIFYFIFGLLCIFSIRSTAAQFLENKVPLQMEALVLIFIAFFFISFSRWVVKKLFFNDPASSQSIKSINTLAPSVQAVILIAPILAALFLMLKLNIEWNVIVYIVLFPVIISVSIYFIVSKFFKL